ncbi:hypothetical protein [Nitratireductor aestuarii]|nr:hypothetical protein [Nitratireductor aestuarii]
MNRFDSNIGDTLQDQLASLASEVASLKKSLRKQGRSAYKDALHVSEDATDWLREQAAYALPEIRRGAHQLQRAAKNNPTATVGIAAAGFFVVGMALAFMKRR